MAAVWQASGSITGQTTSGDVTPTLPAHQADDILILQTCDRLTTKTCATPSGWTLLSGPDDTTNWRSYIFWKRATSGSETNPLCDWTATASDHYATVHNIRGAITSGSPFAATAVTAGGADPAVVTGVTTTAANQLVVVFGMDADNLATAGTTTATDPSSFTQRSFTTNSTGADSGAFFFDATRATTGATGNVSVDFNGVPLHWTVLVAAISEPAAPTEVSLTDTGTGTDALTVSADIPIAETATAADVLDVQVQAQPETNVYFHSAMGNGPMF